MDYVRCTACGLVQQHPMPADVSPFYSAYPVHAQKGWVHERVRRALLSHAYFDASQLAAESVLLDYGCGDGWYLDSLATTGSQRLGYEPDSNQAKRVERQIGVPIFSNLEQLVAEWEGRVDQIVMHFVLEHVTNLRDTLAFLVSLLKPGGQIYAVVPNLDSREFRLFGKRWHGFDAPRHTIFPDATSLQKAGENLPLTLLRSTYVRFPNTFAGSMAIRLRGHYVHSLFLLCLPLGIVWSLFDPTGNQCFVWRKD